MAIYLGSSGVLVLTEAERNRLIAALDFAVDQSNGARSVTRAMSDHWRELRKALAS